MNITKISLITLLILISYSSLLSQKTVNDFIQLAIENNDKRQDGYYQVKIPKKVKIKEEEVKKTCKQKNVVVRNIKTKKTTYRGRYVNLVTSFQFRSKADIRTDVARQQYNVLKIPSINLEDLDEKSIDISREVTSNEYSIICFWASWAPPAKILLDSLNILVPSWKEQLDVEIIAVTTDKSRSLHKVPDLVRRKNWDFKVLSDSDSKLQEELNQNFVYKDKKYPAMGNSAPVIYIADKNGNVIFGQQGYYPNSNLFEKMAELINSISGKNLGGKIIIPFIGTKVDKNITEDQIWTKDGNPYFVQENLPLLVEKGVTLTIEEGVEIKLKSPITINGNLMLNGTEDSAIKIIGTSDNHFFNYLSISGDKMVAQYVNFDKVNIKAIPNKSIQFSNCSFDKNDVIIRNYENDFSSGDYDMIKKENSHFNIFNCYFFEDTKVSLAIMSDISNLNKVRNNIFDGSLTIFDLSGTVSKYLIEQNCFKKRIKGTIYNTSGLKLENNFWDLENPGIGKFKLSSFIEFEGLVPSQKHPLDKCPNRLDYLKE